MLPRRRGLLADGAVSNGSPAQGMKKGPVTGPSASSAAWQLPMVEQNSEDVCYVKSGAYCCWSCPFTLNGALVT